MDISVDDFVFANKHKLIHDCGRNDLPLKSTENIFYLPIVGNKMESLLLGVFKIEFGSY